VGILSNLSLFYARMRVQQAVPELLGQAAAIEKLEKLIKIPHHKESNPQFSHMLMI